MANTLAPFGFEAWGTASGPPNFAENHNPPYQIAGGTVTPQTTAIYYGDLVRMAVSGDNSAWPGTIIQWTAADGAATKIPVGIFVGCEYYSASQQKNVWSRYWPGTSDAVGNASAYVIDDPNQLFKVQSGYASAAITQTSFGQTADINVTPAGNATTGISGMSLAQPTTTTTLPFKVVNFINTPPGANGTDTTTAYNFLIVAFNASQFYKNSAGV